MSYNKLGFTKGQVLKAEHLNHIEEGIANAGGASSWNDLADKPFDVEQDEAVILECMIDTDTQSVSPMDIVGPAIYRVSFDLTGLEPLDAGQEYVVIWNKKSYTCTAKFTENIPFAVIGDTELSEGFASTGEPFLIVFDVNFAIILTTEAGQYPVTVKRSQVIKKLDNKYLDILDHTAGSEIDILAEQDVEFVFNAESEAAHAHILGDMPVFVENSVYVVKYGEQEFVCTAYNSEGLPFAIVGNKSFLGLDSNTNEPFAAIIAPEEDLELTSLAIISNDTTDTTRRISIRQMAEDIYTVKKEYLPDNIGGGMVRINLTDDENGDLIADKTYDEIYTFIINGMIPYCVYGSIMLHLSSADVLSEVRPMFTLESIKFTGIVNTDGPTVHTFTINLGGNMYYEVGRLALESN